MVALWTAAVVVAAAAHLLVGYVYVTSGLVAPLWAVLLLLLVWLALLVVGVRLAHRRSWWVLAIPPAALAVWVAVLSAGEALFGWTA